ncbi:pentapeptide repeat-containing protein [Microbispora sp. CA-135349]|uniref:pentapeptide repeat-containing protein n=1 Tax=Microbispora sp. CA-135349 TaxID=3239953 RepID=UPI003D8B33B5
MALTVVGGVGGVIALVVAYRKQWLNERAELREQTRLNVERLAKAAEQLGADAPAVRLAGVYALASLADDWPRGRQNCIDVLCAYLRLYYIPDPPDALPERRAWHGERQLRHSITRIISARLREGAGPSWQGHDFDFTGAVFDGGEFEDARFTAGRVSFRNAQFRSGVVSFRGTVFAGAVVSFQDARFADCMVSFEGAHVTAGAVNFDDAEFESGEVSFTDARFTGGALSFNAIFCGCLVAFTGAAFRGSDITFAGARFRDGQVDLRDVADYRTPPLLDGQRTQDVFLPPGSPA